MLYYSLSPAITWQVNVKLLVSLQTGVMLMFNLSRCHFYSLQMMISIINIIIIIAVIVVIIFDHRSLNPSNTISSASLTRYSSFNALILLVGSFDPLKLSPI